jgi:hypothetical protein
LGRSERREFGLATPKRGTAGTYAAAVDGDERSDDLHDHPDPGAAPSLGNAVYRWADSTIKPLPFAIRVGIVALIVAFLVFLPLVLFLMLLSRG